jgi:hypothetical protein
VFVSLLQIFLFVSCLCLCVSSRLAGRAADMVSLPEEEEVDMKEERRVWNEEQLIAQARILYRTHSIENTFYREHTRSNSSPWHGSRVCVRACVCIRVLAYVYAYMRMHTCACKYIRVQSVGVCVHARVHIREHFVCKRVLAYGCNV